VVVTKNLAVANYGDILAGIRIDNIALEHVFVLVSDLTFTTPNSPRCSGCRAGRQNGPKRKAPIIDYAFIT
jgi:hypothetical protein